MMLEKGKAAKRFMVIVLLSGIVSILYWRYLTGEYLFLFPDVVNDGITQFLPRYQYVARLYSETGTLGSYSFTDGLGGWLGIKNPFELLIVLFGEDNVPYLIGVKEMFCILLAGVLMSLFFMELEWDFSTCILAGVAYSLSYQLVIGSCWSNQAELAIIAAIFLLTVEKIFHRKYLWGMMGMACLIMLRGCFGLYQLLLYGGLGCIYLMARIGAALVRSHKISMRKLLAIYGAAMAAAAGLLLLYAYYKMGYIFESDRFLNGVHTWKAEWRNTFSLLNVQNILTSYYRTIAPNMMGISWLDNYHGMPMQSCLDDGGFYCTILAIYCGVILLDKKSGCQARRLGIFALLAVCIMVCFPGIRLFVNGFVNVTYKLSRLWMILFWEGIMLFAWQEKISCKKDIRLSPIMSLAVIISVSLFIPFFVTDDYIYVKEVVKVLIFLWIYALLFWMWQKYPLKRGMMRYLFLFICCVEGISLNYGFVNNRNALREEEWREGYYNDGTKEAIEEIERYEDEICRINKSYQSVMLCDPIAQNYYSTTFYRGGVDESAMSAFIKTFSLPTMCNKMGYLTGTYGYPALSSVLGVKYIITNGTSCMESDFEYVGEVGQKRIYSNNRALPFVFGYQTVITNDELLALPLRERHNAIVQGCFINEKDLQQLQNGMKRGSEHIKINEVEPRVTYVYKDWEIAKPLEFEPLEKGEIAVVRVRDDENKCVNLYWKTQNEGWHDKNFRTFSIYAVNGESFMELAGQEGLQGIIFYGFDERKIETLDEVIVEIYEEQQYYELLEEAIDELRESGIVYEAATEFEIAGKLTMKQDGIIFISIPYGAPYLCYVNGVQAETICVNGIFSGIVAEAGTYEVSIRKED